MYRKSIYLVSGTAVAILAVVGLLAAPHYSKQIQTQSCMNVPILKLTSSDGHWARTPIIIGQRLTWEDDSTRKGFTFIPKVLDGDKSVSVRIEKLEDGKSETLETLELPIGAKAVASAKSPFKIEILSPLKTERDAVVRPVSYEGPTPRSVRASPLAQCCVTCLGGRLCGDCYVSTDCGCCCTGYDACCAFCF
jgi:hypothetical protein